MKPAAFTVSLAVVSSKVFPEAIVMMVVPVLRSISIFFNTFNGTELFFYAIGAEGTGKPINIDLVDRLRLLRPGDSYPEKQSKKEWSPEFS